MVSAARRLAARAEYLELAAVAEFARRARAACGESAAAGARPGRRASEFATTELAFELVSTDHAAEDRMDLALALTSWLPATFAGLRDGTIDGAKASAIWYYTRFLSDEHAAQADRELAGAAPGLRYDQLARKAARLEMKMDPEGAKERKEHARKEGRRVEARREVSGNMSFGGRELDAAEALAAKALNDTDAIAPRRAASRAACASCACSHSRTGWPAATRSTAPPPNPPAPPQPPPTPPPAPAPPPPTLPALARSAGPAPLPALINLLVPAGTLLGWFSTRAGRAHRGPGWAAVLSPRRSRRRCRP